MKLICVNFPADMQLDQLKRKFGRGSSASPEEDEETSSAFDDCGCYPLCNDVLYSANTEPVKVEKPITRDDVPTADEEG